MRRGSISLLFLLIILVALALPSIGSAQATGEEQVLVLPLRSIGVSDTTISVVRDLLAGELEARGVRLIGIRERLHELPVGPDGCDEIDCAISLGERFDADLVIYGSISRLGDKIIARVRALRMAESVPFYRDQLSATTEEDLDRVMLRIAEGIASGGPNSTPATVESVTHEETREPRLRAVRKGLGIRAGFLFPLDDSYGDVDRLTMLRVPYKYETRNYFIETTTIAGLSFGGGFDAVDWTIFDLFGARIFGLGDHASYLGAGLGVHSVHVEKDGIVTETHGTNTYEYEGTISENATTFAIDLGAGILGLRTFDFEIVLDLRYHYVFEDFEKVNGKGAHGIALTFGTQR